MISSRATLLLACAAIAAGCETFLGVDDLVVVQPAADSGDELTADDGAPDRAAAGEHADEPGADSGNDATADARDASTPDSDACVPSGPESCNDGVDNDCDGLVDCADPACKQSGWTCVPDVAGPWTYAAIDPTDSVACPSGTSQQTFFASASGAAATCGCNCVNGQLPSCNTGSFVAALGSTATCGDGPLTFQATGCTAVATFQTAAYVSASPPAASGGTCNPNPSKSVPSLQETKWRACESAGPFGKGCAAGEVCAPGGSSFSKCIVQSGSPSCPSAYPTAKTVGTGVSDTRDCTQCGCGGPTATSCTGGTLSYYSDSQCQTGPVTSVSIDGVCNAESSGIVYQSYKYTAVANETCGSPNQPPTPNGSVTLTGTSATCCMP